MSTDPKQYYYGKQQPFEYLLEGVTQISSLAVDVKDLYPTNWLLNHENDEDKAKAAFMQLPARERYPHLWLNGFIGEKRLG